MSGRPRGSERASGSTAARRRETSAGGVVVHRGDDGRVAYLLIRDPYGNWGLPKGHIEGIESALDAARREIEEETGVQVDRPLAVLPTVDWYFQDGATRVHKYCHFFLFEARSRNVHPQISEGISACEWLTLDDALERMTYDNTREILRDASARLHTAPDSIA